jgi:hypothetical protein
LRPYSPGGALNTLAPAEKVSKPPLPSAHRLQLGLPGYLILFAPLAFAHQCQERPRESLSPPAFLLISTHFTATPGIPLSPTDLKQRSTEDASMGEPWDFIPRLRRRLHALYAQ